MKTEREPGAQGDASSLTPNPIAQSSQIYLSVPEELEIRLVDASVLADYEVWIGLTTILLTSTVSSFVAWLGDREQVAIGVLAGVFAVMTCLTGLMVCVKRRALSRKRQAVKYRLGEAVSLSGDTHSIVDDTSGQSTPEGATEK